MEETSKPTEKIQAKCLKCGKPFPETLSQCPYCRAPRLRLDKNVKSVKCKKCSADLPPTKLNCPYCGSLQGRLVCNLISISVIIVSIVVIFAMSLTKNAPEAKQSVPVRGYVSCGDKVTTLTTYAVYLGRAVACGQDIGRPMEYVGAWIDECFDSSEKASHLVIFEAGTRMNATNQKNGNSPDSCEQVIKTFNKVTWPDNNQKQTPESK